LQSFAAERLCLRDAVQGHQDDPHLPLRKGLVSGTIETLIVNAPKYSSSILTMMRRVGDCPGQQHGRPL
jgi:hypothetical protein